MRWDQILQIKYLQLVIELHRLQKGLSRSKPHIIIRKVQLLKSLVHPQWPRDLLPAAVVDMVSAQVEPFEGVAELEAYGEAGCSSVTNFIVFQRERLKLKMIALWLDQILSHREAPLAP